MRSAEPARPWRADRLCITAATAEDEGELLALLRTPEIARTYFLGGPGPHGDAAAEALWADALRTEGRFLGIARLDGDRALVGALHLRGAELSYFVAPRLWGAGLGKALVRAACAEVAPALGLDRLEATVARDNVRSCRVLEACAFRFVGRGEAFLVDRARRPMRLSVLRYVRALGAKGASDPG